MESLSPKLKVALMGVILLETVTAYTNVINGLYNDILCSTLKYIP